MKRVLLFVFAALIMLSVKAAPVNQDEALKLASSFMRVRMGEKALPVETLRAVSLDHQLNLNHLYIFSGEHSFVILSADDRAMPVLAYALDRPFDTEDMPVNMLAWLQGYENEIRFLEEHGVEASASVKEAWSTLAEGALWQPVNRSEVLPLIATKWGQHAPFNYNCPNNCVTGCVATAMSQIMKYWEYPNKGTGYHSYFHASYGSLHADFGNTSYNWDNMTLTPDNSCSLAEKQAIGTLLFHSGVAVEMEYGPDVSASYSSDVPEAMIQYFGYNPEIVMDEKAYYTDAGWKTLIKNELNQSRPVYYAGNNANSDGGHAFICDGYDNRDYFHFNWGWTGNHDAFYMIGSLNPDNFTDLNYLNRIITGLYPASYSIQAPTNLRATVQEKDVHLSWNATSGASSYNVYRDGSLIARGISGTSYDDVQLGYGNYSYYVKAIKSNGDRSPRSSSAEAHIVYSIPAPTAVTGQFNHDDVSLTLRWNMPTLEEAAFSYGTGPYSNYSYGYGGNNPTYWAQCYPVSTLVSYAGMKITAVKAYFRYTGNYLLYLYAINGTGDDILLLQQEYNCTSSGMNVIELTDPVAVDYMHDLFVGFYAPESMPYPAAYCDYYGDGLGYASFISPDGGSWNSHASDYISWMFEIFVESPDYTYKITKDGVVVADHLSDRLYQDTQLSSGTSNYKVQASYDGETSSYSETCSIALADIQVSIDNPAGGEVSGGGLYEVGGSITLRATAHTGYQFKGWKESGATVSTNPVYSFVVANDRALTASFQRNNGVGEQQESFVLYPNPIKSQLHIESGVVIRQLELVTVDGVVVETKIVDATEVECSMEPFAKGVYFLRLVTDDGVVVKKVLLSD